MKSFILLFMALLFLGITTCKNTTSDLIDSKNSIWKISPGSKSQVIENEIKGIAFKFCLLNDQGKPATVFNEGENFNFYFSVTNKTKEKLLFFPEFAYPETKDNNFCEIFTSDNQRIGKPFVFGGYDKVGIAGYPFNHGESCTFEQPWIDMRDSTWRWKYAYYESNHQTPLPVGDYFTKFESRFQFDDQGANFLDTILKFKINFKIQ